MSIAYVEPDLVEMDTWSTFARPWPVWDYDPPTILFLVTAGTTSGLPLLMSMRNAVRFSMTSETHTDDMVVPMSDSELVRWIKENSGLTWDQVARVFDVSRRTVHLWAKGSRVSARNAEAIREFAALVSEVGGRTPTSKRSSLLAIGSDGLSALDRFRRVQYDAASDVTGTPLTPAELLGSSTEAVQ